MAKWLIPIILLIAVIQIVTGAVECQISSDNITFVNITNVTYGGEISGDIARIESLNASTEYSIRCKNDTTSWGYVTVETNGGGVDEMEIALMLGIGLLSFFFLYFAFQLGNDHFFLKLLLLFFAITTIIVIPNALLTGEEGSSAAILLNITTWFFRVFIIYFSVYLFWHWIQKSEAFMGILEKMKGKFSRR